jgi:hypothetical protein
MPADAVIDWSIDWRPLLQRVELSELSSLRAPALVVGTDGSLDRDGEDLFAAPGAMDPALTQIWQGAERKVPGVLIQSVLAQSMSLRHWLTPISQALTTALAAGLLSRSNRESNSPCCSGPEVLPAATSPGSNSSVPAPRK